MKAEKDFDIGTLWRRINEDQAEENRNHKYACNYELTKHFLHSPYCVAINPFEWCLHNVPVVIANSGETLGIKEIDLLREYKIPVIAVDNAVKRLRAGGVEPFLIVTADYQETCADMIKYQIPNKKTFVAVSPFVSDKTLYEACTGSIVVYSLITEDKSGFIGRFNDKYGVTQLMCASTVGTVAMTLAIFMGMSPIVFTGLDLGYEKLENVPEGKEPIKMDNGTYSIIDFLSSKMWYEKCFKEQPIDVYQTSHITPLKGAKNILLPPALEICKNRFIPNVSWTMGKIHKKWSKKHATHYKLV